MVVSQASAKHQRQELIAAALRVIQGGGRVLTRRDSPARRGDIEERKRSVNLKAAQAEIERIEVAKMRELKARLEQAFDAFTRQAAYAAFAEDHLGTLEPGRWADFLFLDRDIFMTSDPREIRETRVLETWIAGRKAWERVSAAEPR